MSERPKRIQLRRTKGWRKPAGAAEAVIRRRRRLYDMLRRHHVLPATPAWDTAEERA